MFKLPNTITLPMRCSFLARVLCTAFGRSACRFFSALLLDRVSRHIAANKYAD
ncbi:hypothetical protein HMPREF1492_1181 [Atopobium sp. BS2]|nr:hypothetical protein HMPREF1492_1181 [Atopobium sp. BS2]